MDSALRPFPSLSLVPAKAEGRRCACLPPVAPCKHIDDVVGKRILDPYCEICERTADAPQQRPINHTAQEAATGRSGYPLVVVAQANDHPLMCSVARCCDEVALFYDRQCRFLCWQCNLRSR